MNGAIGREYLPTYERTERENTGAVCENNSANIQTQTRDAAQIMRREQQQCDQHGRLQVSKFAID
jgi:hypothetical protein